MPRQRKIPEGWEVAATSRLPPSKYDVNRVGTPLVVLTPEEQALPTWAQERIRNRNPSMAKDTLPTRGKRYGWWYEYRKSVPYGQPGWANSDRGWLMDQDGHGVASYLDYGADYYHGTHEYCREGRCMQCQPGGVHAMIHGVLGAEAKDVHWFPSVQQAKEWLEATLAGRLAPQRKMEEFG